MKRKFLYGTLALFVSFCGMLTLYAAQNRVEIVTKTSGEKPVGTDGAAVLYTIENSQVVVYRIIDSRRQFNYLVWFFKDKKVILRTCQAGSFSFDYMGAPSAGDSFLYGHKALWMDE